MPFHRIDHQKGNIYLLHCHYKNRTRGPEILEHGVQSRTLVTHEEYLHFVSFSSFAVYDVMSFDAGEHLMAILFGSNFLALLHRIFRQILATF